MRIDQRFIEVNEFNQFYDLIKNNRNRLLDYFPNTVKEISSIEKARDHLENCRIKRERKEQFLFGLYHSQNLIGYLNVKNINWDIPKCELGYFIDSHQQGKGIMTKQIKQVLVFCFENLGMAKVYLRIGQENTGSIIIAKKNGFKQEGLIRKDFRTASNELIDVAYYGIIREDFK